MNENIKQQIIKEIAEHKKNSKLIKAHITLLAIFIIQFILFLYAFVKILLTSDINNDFDTFAVVSFFISTCFTVPAILIINALSRNKVENKISKYFGTDETYKSTINPINFEMIGLKEKIKHKYKIFKIIKKLEKRVPYQYKSDERVICVLNGVYNDVEYSINIASYYWQIQKRRMKITYTADDGTNYYAVISFNANINPQKIQTHNPNCTEYNGDLVVKETYKIAPCISHKKMLNDYIDTTDDFLNKIIEYTEQVIDETK